MHRGPFFPALHRILAFIHNFFSREESLSDHTAYVLWATRGPFHLRDALGRPLSCHYHTALGKKIPLGPHPSDDMLGFMIAPCATLNT